MRTERFGELLPVEQLAKCACTIIGAAPSEGRSGNSVVVAAKYYLQITDEHSEQAVDGAGDTESGAATARNQR